MKRPGKSHLVTLVIGLVLGAIALGAVQAAISVTSDVRVGVRRLDDGRIEVGLQQNVGEQGWTDLEAPPARFLPLDAEIDDWLYSSTIEVTTTVEEEPEVIIQPLRPVMCVHGHAYPQDDRFWQWTLAASSVVGVQYGVDMRLYAARDSAEHANDILDCIEQDPIAIATSLPYAEDLAPALAAAKAAGIPVITFNSGAGDADSVGSLLHIGLDDLGGGVRAGDEFDEAGVTGVLLCVIHESDNIGLNERCEGATAGYDGGEVETISVDPAGATNPATVQEQLAERIAAGDVGAILTLNHDTGMAALAAVEASEEEIAVASFGFSDQLADAVRNGQMLFVVWDHPVIQGYLAVSAMALAFTIENSQLNASVFLNGAKILIEPTLADAERAASLQSIYKIDEPFEDQTDGPAETEGQSSGGGADDGS